MPSSFHDCFPAELAALGEGVPGGQTATLAHRLLIDRFVPNAAWERMLRQAWTQPKIEADRGAVDRFQAFLDEYSWQLTDGPLVGHVPQRTKRARGTLETCSTLTPDLLGNLFEMHANRRTTGTYYTPADVTDFIARSTIVPWLLERIGLTPECPAWERLRTQPERYLSSELSKTGRLPTETAAEHAARRARVRRLKTDLRVGQVTSVAQLVTMNLDVLCFAQDLAAEPDYRDALQQGLQEITILDPTCGSGAFLFAALRVLEQLAAACGLGSGVETRAALLGRLHGVDLAPDAVELCRLRLLLKLLSLAEREEMPVVPDLRHTIQSGDALTMDWQAAFGAGGFAVILGNPPYVSAKSFRDELSEPPALAGGVRGVDASLPPLTRGARHSEARLSLLTAGCPDVYAWVLERSARLLQPGGWSGMIVPLSLAFSQDFAACRQLLFSEYSSNWFSSFARIPAALFAGDVRVRNTIHIGRQSGQRSVASDPKGSENYTTRLHRWFEAGRPQLFPTLVYVSFGPTSWGGRVPRLGSSALLDALAALLDKPGPRLGDFLSPRPTRYALHFKKTAYNWLTFCRRLPPCHAADGRRIPHTQFDVLYFPTEHLRDLALLLLNGKWAFAFWCAVGDDFHVTRSTCADFPIDLAGLPPAALHRLRALVRPLEHAMQEEVAFKRNAGKRVGTYNLARCRHVTDQSDRILGRCLGLDHLWADVELLTAQVVKTDFSGEDSTSAQRTRLV